MTNLPDVKTERTETVYIHEEVLDLIRPEAPVKDTSRLVSLLSMIMLYAAFLFALGIVYAMNMAWVAPTTAVGALSVLALTAILLLVRILHTR